MKTLPEILDDLVEVKISDNQTGYMWAKLSPKTKKAIAKELMGIIGEDDDPWYEVNNANAAIAIKLNELRANQRVRLTAFIGEGDKNYE